MSPLKKTSCHLTTLTLALLLAACEHPALPPAPPRAALTMIVGAADHATPTALVGEIRPRYEAAQSFRIAGKIIERRVEIGTPVKKGQILARLDPADTGLSAQSAQAQVRAAEADYALAQAEFERQKQLYARQFISHSALDTHEAQLKSAAAHLQQIRAQAAVAANQSRYTALIAERDGVVTEIRAEPGQVVEASEVVARVAVPGEMEVVIAVPESRMTGVIAGAPAQIRLWVAREKAYSGRIREVAPIADTTTRTFQVRVSVLHADAAVRLGMTAGVKLASLEDKFLLLPSAAVTQINGQSVVWVVDPKTSSANTHRVQPRVVQTGAFREDGVLVLSGLAAGERIVVAGVHTLLAGQVVRPIDAGVGHEPL
ncbi:MAG: efflux RND transporter periplasmic adaptor subunit [Methylophilaceae bacterium]